MSAKWLTITIAIFIVFSSLGSPGECEDLASAEKSAWIYMTSVLRGDVETSFSLMDPRVLNRRKADIVQAYRIAQEQGKADEFKARFKNIDDLDSSLRLPAKQFFILLVKKDRENAPAEHLKAMQETVVNVIGSSRLDAETARVNLEIIAPKSINDGPQKDGLILTLYGGRWKVVENAK